MGPFRREVSSSYAVTPRPEAASQGSGDWFSVYANRFVGQLQVEPNQIAAC